MTLPEGLIYVPGFVTEAGERDLLALLAAFELHPYVLHDTPSRRLVRSFGLALVTGAYDIGPWVREPPAGGRASYTGEGQVSELRCTRCGPALRRWRNRCPVAL